MHGFATSNVGSKLRKKKNVMVKMKEEKRERMDLEESGGVGNVVPDSALSGNANLILVNGRFLPRLLYPLIPIHVSLSLQNGN